MFDDAANALEEIEPEDKTRNEVLHARVDIYLTDENDSDEILTQVSEL